jgi:hypothetical protein
LKIYIYIISEDYHIDLAMGGRHEVFEDQPELKFSWGPRKYPVN